MTPTVVAGGCVAALVAADALGRKGRPVELLLPARGVGGGFAPMRRGGHELELGVRLLELDYEGVGEPPPLEAYVPGDHRPFVRRIAEWAHELLGDRLREVPAPRMLSGGRDCRDLLFATDPLALRDALPGPDRSAAATQAAGARARLGDAGLDEAALAATDLESASRAMHGRVVHERLIGPYVDKLLPGGAAGVVAALRRKAWVPLLWPRTVAEACGQGPVAFVPHRPFHAVDGPGGVIGALLDRLRSLPSVTIREGDLPTLDELREARRPVIGLPPPGYSPQRARTAIAWVTGTEIPPLINIVDPELDVVRLSGRDGVLTCELRHNTDVEDHGAVLGSVRAALDACGLAHRELGLVAALAAPTFALPTRANALAFDRARITFDGLDAEVVGGACGFGADSFNEQVVQGLRAAEAIAA